MSHIRLFKHYIPSPIVVLGAVEFCVLLISLFVGSAIRFGLYGDDVFYDSQLVVASVVYALIMMSCTAAMGVYSAGFRDGLGAMAVRSLVAYCLLGCGLITILFYLIPGLYLGRGILAIAIIFTLVSVAPIRFIFFHLVDKESLRPRVLILGVGERAKNIAKELTTSHRGVASVVGYVQTCATDTVLVEGEVIAHTDTLLELAQRYAANEIVVAMDERRVRDGGVFPLYELFECKMNGIRVNESITLYERELGFLELNEIGPAWLVFSTGFSSSSMLDAMKRFSDVLVALILLVFAWPLMLLAVLLILIETGSPVIYRQIRTGVGGRPFEILKFRSMTKNAEQEGKAVWASHNDSRITRVGAFLRNTRIDELPQLFNVLRGDMSFVGPRPERPQFVEQLIEELPFYAERHRVKPGLMGWAQLNYPYGASIEDAAQKLRYDLYYVKNRSLLLDIIIMVQTVQIILLGSGVR